MAKIKTWFNNLPLKQSITLFIVSFALLAFALMMLTAILCQIGTDAIHQKYSAAAERYYLTNTQGQQLGEGTLIYTSPLSVTAIDEKRLLILNKLPLLTTPLYCVLCLLAATFFFYRSKLKKPLAQLTLAAEKIAKQDLDFTITYAGQDELGQLCQSFEQTRIALAQSYQNLWQQMTERQQLNSALTHDLRTPLTILKGYHELLTLSGTEQDAAVIVDAIGRQIQRLEHYLDTFHHLQRLEDRETMPQTLDCFVFAQTLAQTATVFCQKQQKQLKTIFQLNVDSLTADELMIQQVFDNLLANSVRYAHRTITIIVKTTENGLTLSVADDGDGFSSEALKKGCSPYFTEENNRQTHLGLGLYIAQLLCQRHHGTLTLANHEKGAIITAFFGQCR